MHCGLEVGVRLDVGSTLESTPSAAQGDLLTNKKTQTPAQKKAIGQAMKKRRRSQRMANKGFFAMVTCCFLRVANRIVS